MFAWRKQTAMPSVSKSLACARPRRRAISNMTFCPSRPINRPWRISSLGSESARHHDGEEIGKIPCQEAVRVDNDLLLAGMGSARNPCRALSDPVEGARLGCAILHGPEVEDFEEIYRALDEAGGSALVFDPDSLAKRLARIFTDRAKLRAMGRAAAATAEAFGGASERIIEALAPYLAQAMVNSSGAPG